MGKRISSSEEPPFLVFNWPSRQHRQRSRLPLILVLSLVCHLGAFYILQAVYPPPIAHFPAGARIAFLSDGARNLPGYRWIEAQDPANVFADPNAGRGGTAVSGQGGNPPVPHPATVVYRPSFADAQPRPAPVPEELTRAGEGPILTLGRELMGMSVVEDFHAEFPPSSRSAFPESEADSKTNAHERGAPAPMLSMVVLSCDTKVRDVIPLPQEALLRSSVAPRAGSSVIQPGVLQPSRYLVGFGDSGRNLVFTQESCGVPAMDRSVADFLRSLSVDQLPLVSAEPSIGAEPPPAGENLLQDGAVPPDPARDAAFKWVIARVDWGGFPCRRRADNGEKEE